MRIFINTGILGFLALLSGCAMDRAINLEIVNRYKVGGIECTITTTAIRNAGGNNEITDAVELVDKTISYGGTTGMVDVGNNGSFTNFGDVEVWFNYSYTSVSGTVTGSGVYAASEIADTKMNAGTSHTITIH